MAKVAAIRDIGFLINGRLGAKLWAMNENQEEKLIEALKKVDIHGDVAPAHVQDPMTMVLRQRAIQGDLIRWDDNRGHYVLTGTGRNRISARHRAPAVVIRFRPRGDKDDEAAAI